MNDTDRKLIDAIVRKAEAVCPGSLALIGLYGSAATGDMHEKSDLDLLVLINDERGRQLAKAFILKDIGVGYDLYCTNWEGLEGDALCSHAHLSKLLDSPIVHIADPAAVQRLENLRKKALDTLASQERFAKAQALYENAKGAYADCCMAEDIGSVRTAAGGAIYFLLDAAMLHFGRYFKLGVKRTFEEISTLPLPFSMQDMVMAVICAKSAQDIKDNLSALMRRMRALIYAPAEKAAPSAQNLSGTYEEMYSNWRNKMGEAARRKDVYSSFMAMLSMQFMLDDIAQETAVAKIDLLQDFDPDDLCSNRHAFDAALAQYLREYEKIGLHPARFADADAFVSHYLAEK